MERPTVVYGVERCRVVVSGIEVEGRWKPVPANFLFEDLPPITTLKAVHPLTTSSSTLASLLMEEGLPPSQKCIWKLAGSKVVQAETYQPNNRAPFHFHAGNKERWDKKLFAMDGAGGNENKPLSSLAKCINSNMIAARRQGCALQHYPVVPPFRFRKFFNYLTHVLVFLPTVFACGCHMKLVSSRVEPSLYAKKKVGPIGHRREKGIKRKRKT